MARAAEDQDLFPDEGTTELIEAAERKRARVPLRDAPAGAPRPAPSGDTPPASRRAERKRSSDGFVAADIPPQATEDDEAVERKAPRRRRPAAAIVAGVRPGLVTRGVHAGLDGAQAAAAGIRRLGPWAIAAMALGLTVVVLSVYALTTAPEPMPVRRLRIDFLPGPQVAEREVQNWLGRFPYRDKLVTGDAWVLDHLATYLAALPAVATVRRVETVHEPVGADSEELVRMLVLEIGLRQPVMPALLATGERVWLDQEGRVLPGTLPAPAQRRPLLRDLERGGLPVVREVLDLWRDLETKLEPGLVTDIRCNDPLDQGGVQRGIVLYTRQGTRLVWGHPSESRYGVHATDKINDLVRTIRCQGDLRRIAVINVRFGRPFFLLRGSDMPQLIAPPAAPRSQAPGAPRMTSAIQPQVAGIADRPSVPIAL